MEDLLLLKYPAKAGKITALRGMGVGDDEIESAMRERVQGLLSQGVSQAEVNDALGFTETQRARLNEASRNNALEFVGRTWEMGHGEAKSLFETAETHNVPLHSLLNTPDMVKAIKEKDLGPLHERPTVEAFVTQNPGFARIDSPVYRTVGGVASGFLATEATFWRGVEWLTHWDKAKQWGDSLMDMSTSVSKSVMEGKDPNLWDATMQGLGSTAFFLIPGMIAGYGVGATSAITGAVLGLKEKAVMSMSKWLGAGVSGSMEGLAEAGDVYRTILDATGDEGAATMAAAKTFWLNLPLNIVLDKFAFFDDNPMFKKWFMKMMPERAAGVAGGVTGRFFKEGLQETVQGGISEQALTDKPWAQLDWLKVAAEQGLPGGLAASVFGLGMGHQAALSPSETPEKAAERQTSVKEIFQTIRDAAVSAGHYEDAATGAAAITASFYNTMAKRYGVNAGELFRKRNLQIQQGVDAPATTGMTLNQADVETPEFKAWFGDSKVVDEQGKPLVVYRGESGYNREFTEFDRDKTNENAFFFTPDPNIAGVYATKGGKPRAFYLKAENLLDLSRMDQNSERFVREWAQKWDDWVDRETGEEADPVEVVESGRLFDWEGGWSGKRWKDLQSTIEDAGYDGAILPDYDNREGVFPAYIVFSPTQIKSIDNEGTFDPNNPNIYKQDARGQINLGNGEAVISLFKTADRSTLIHEMSHLMLEEIRTMALTEDAPDGLKRDWATLSNWLGIKPGEAMTVDAHEKFARGMEAYIMEGTAPSPTLRSVFETFRKWLVDIYRNVKALNVEMNDEVRSIFDRLLATDDEIEAEAMQTAEATVTEEDDDPETQLEQADREMVDALIDEDEEVMFDPSWFDDEGTEEGREEVDTMLQGEERFALERENMRQWRGLLNAVRNAGGIAYESVRTAFGPESAQELWRVAGGIFKAGGATLDKMTQVLQESGYNLADWNDLYNQMMARPKTPEAPPLAPVNAETMPWLLDRLGPKESLRYVNRRLRVLGKEINFLTGELERVKNEGANPDDLIAVRDALQGRYKELEYVKEQSKGLKASVDAEKETGQTGKVPEAPLTMIEALQLAKQGAVKWTQETVKDAIERVTGKTKIGDLMEEDRALREALKMAKRNARIAYRAGVESGQESVQPALDQAKGKLAVEKYKRMDAETAMLKGEKRSFRAGKQLGYIEARMKVKALQERIRERNEEKKMIAKMVHEIDHAMDGNIRVTQKEEIRKLLEGYDLKRRSRETLEIRREMEAFFREHPEAIPEANAKDVYYIGRRTLSEMEIDDLGELHEKVMAIREEGKKAYALWEAERKERVDTWRQSLINVMGGRKRRKGDRVNGKLTQEETLRLKAAENTWIPDSVFRFMEGSTKGDGAFSKVFLKTANLAEDAKLRMLHRRHERMNKALEALGFEKGLESPKLYEERMKDQDPETGEEVTWTLDGLMNVYIGWQNPRFREALRYGLNITPERYEMLAGKLTDEERKAALLVVKDHSLERDELNKAFENGYNLHLAEEPNYIRLYRDTFEADKKLIDANDEELANDLLFQVNGAQKFYTSRGFTFERKDIPPEMQAKIPPKLGLFSNWLSAVEEESHWVGYGELVRDLHALMGERWHPELPSFKESIENRWGRETFDFLQDYVNRISRSHFYHGYTAVDAAARKLRGNMGTAYLAFNVMTIIKQPTVLALTMSRAGLPRTMLALGGFIANPKGMLQRVWELDPQVKEQSMDRFIEELKRTVKPDAMKRFSKVGFKPIMWLDMFARVVGWEAVYRDELAKLRKQGMSPEEAHERAREEAQRFTLRVNNAASPKDIPRYMAHDEILNLITVFTNQANKVWSLATYDVPFSFKEGKWVEGFSTACGLLLMGFLTSLVAKGRPPEDPKEALAWASSEVAQSIPLFGKAFMSQLQGFQGSTTPVDTIARDVGKLVTNVSKGKIADIDNVGVIMEAYALTRGVPYTPLKRVIQAAKTGNPLALIGWMRQEKKRRKVAMY